MSSVNNALSTSTRCKCRWLTLARAPGLLKPIRNRLACSLASSDNENSRATSLSTWGEFPSTSGQIRQWLRVSGLLLTRKLIRWPLKGSSKRRSSAFVLLKLKACGSKAGRREVILWGGRRRVVLFSFNYNGWTEDELGRGGNNITDNYQQPEWGTWSHRLSFAPFQFAVDTGIHWAVGRLSPTMILTFVEDRRRLKKSPSWRLSKHARIVAFNRWIYTPLGVILRNGPGDVLR